MAWAEQAPLHILVTGIQGPALANVQSRLQILEQSYGKDLTDANIKSFYKHAETNIKKALEPYGYFKAHITSKLVRQNEQWIAAFKVNPGPVLPITVLDLKIEGPGSTDPLLQKLIKNLPLQKGSAFQAEIYEKAKLDLFETLVNQGYLKASIEKKEILIDLKQYTAAITLHILTGERYFFGEINFDQTDFSQQFLQRFLIFKPGEPYSSKKILAFQDNLNNSHFFKEATVEPDIQHAQNNLVPVRVKLIANKTHQYNAGIGYGTYTGARLTLGMNLQHLTNTGNHFTLQTKLSRIMKGLAVQYIIPGANPVTDSYTIGANIQRFLPKNGQVLSKTLSAGYTKAINTWKHTLDFNYLSENSYTNGDISSRNSRIFYPSYTLTQTQADDILNPSRGHVIQFSVKGASEQFLSNTSFIQGEIKGKYILSPTTVSRIILRGDLGYTIVKNLNALPISLLFYSGGLESVRGYPFSYEGPGRYLKVGSLEYQHRIVDKWNAAIFYDAGVASDHFKTPLDRSAGVGAIYESIVGPIKLYLAKQLNGDKDLAVEFSIGPEL
jgi:translocation and assembly module TamA